MIVLDEQLMGRSIRTDIAAWYPGRVCYVTDLRPGTVIKDDAIPSLIAHHPGAIFVTINSMDFWGRVVAHRSTCIICVAVEDSRASEVPAMVRRFVSHRKFSTKQLRAGVMARLTPDSAVWVRGTDPIVLSIEPWA